MKIHRCQSISEDEYLALEARSPVRHEYIAGEVFAMTGASIRHNVIAGNIFTDIGTYLHGPPIGLTSLRHHDGMDCRSRNGHN